MSVVGMYGPEVVLNGLIPAPLAMPSKSITVTNIDNSAAVLYTDATGVTTTSNVVVTDARGQLVFYAAPGYYKLGFTDGVGTQALVVEVPVEAAVASATYLTKVNPTSTGQASHTQLTGATATDVYTANIQRQTSYTGGTPGFVNHTLRVLTTVGSGAAAYEWGISCVLTNNATAGQNAAFYGKGIRAAAGVGPTWAGVLEILDTSTAANPTTGTVALEVDINCNGTDTNNNRIGIDLVVSNLGTGSGTQGQAYAALRIGQPNSALGKWNNGILIYGDNGTGINVTGTTARVMLVTGVASTAVIDIQGAQSLGIRFDGGTFSGAAIRLGRGQKVAYEATSSFTSYLDNAVDVVQFASGGTAKVGLAITTPALQLNGTQVVSTRETGYTAMTGSPDKATAYATSTVTLAQLAGRVAALQASLTTHGLIGT